MRTRMDEVSQGAYSVQSSERTGLELSIAFGSTAQSAHWRTDQYRRMRNIEHTMEEVCHVRITTNENKDHTLADTLPFF